MTEAELARELSDLRAAVGPWLTEDEKMIENALAEKTRRLEAEVDKLHAEADRLERELARYRLQHAGTAQGVEIEAGRGRGRGRRSAADRWLQVA
jgi:hypothetical protein